MCATLTDDVFLDFLYKYKTGKSSAKFGVCKNF